MNPKPPFSQDARRAAFIFSALALMGTVISAVANGIDRTGHGAGSMGVAGASLANEGDAVTSMAANPANLARVRDADFYLSLVAATGSGRFRSDSGVSGRLSDSAGAFPEIVFRTPVADHLSLGLSLIPESTRLANWVFMDPLGGIDGATSYGQRDYRSEIVNLRAAAGFGLDLTESLSFGASIGLVHSRNSLTSPYTFQTQPAVAGLKTLLDLETDAFGFNADFGLTWRAADSLTLALAYRTPTRFDSSGKASGDIGAQFQSLGIGGPSDFRYDADIITRLPPKVSLGARWRAAPQIHLSSQLDWTGWSQAYDTLRVGLRNGTNPTINSMIGSSDFRDEIALRWKDRFTLRSGIEYQLTDDTTLRFGHSFGESPVPSSTLLPMTAAITRHTLAVGVGHVCGPWSFDVAWQYDLPEKRDASASAITGLEFRDSSVSVHAHWLAFTLGRTF